MMSRGRRKSRAARHYDRLVATPQNAAKAFQSLKQIVYAEGFEMRIENGEEYVNKYCIFSSTAVGFGAPTSSNVSRRCR